MSFLLGGHKMIHPTQGGLLLNKFENHCPKVHVLISHFTKESSKRKVTLCDCLVFCREEWTKAIQAVADSLQKQEEERIDSSPDPMDMEMYLSKPRLKVVGLQQKF